MTKKIISIILPSLLLSCGVNMSGEQSSTSNISNTKQAVASKTGYYSMERTIKSSKEYQEAIIPLQKEMSQAEGELNKQETKLQSISADLKKMHEEATKKRNELNAKQKLLSPEAKNSLQNSISEIEQEMQEKSDKAMSLNQQLGQKYQQFESYAMQKEQAIRRPILEKILNIVDKIRESQGWDALIPVEVKVSERVDLTKDITNNLNQNYVPASPKAETSPKASTKPAAKA